MRYVVWVDAWQLECCGEPFSTGDRVAWTMRPADRPNYVELLGPDLAAALTHHEEHHGAVPEDAPPVHATVRGITAVLGHHDATSGKPVTTRLAERHRVAGEGGGDGQDVAWDERVHGYVVELDADG
ncbi:DUF6578 domain-containing protein [Terrabacter sp. 2RAF25]|uniref:DUF6578 domain-containing protein n=1 Tax=Terrabacter sp. 2RAF25 TaxID=3232998 RepID=UPI003F9CE2D6